MLFKIFEDLRVLQTTQQEQQH